MHITFRPATLADAAALPAIERSAGQRFLEVPDLAWIADDHIVCAEQHREYAAKRMSWLALADDRPVGFLLGEAMGSSLYIAEFSLHLAWQGKGIGRQLIDTVAQWAREQGFTALTLTTFRHVGWNAPLYQHLGFEILEDDALPAALRQKREEETAHGIAFESRCAMRLMLN
ncbi:TPA: GNAT family N-acetyltransferase [Citrobacter farmeri]|uniref:GNAT family N-acetyltransferase n=1 Tax=Citrobacter farmeri TaxID=67824 RepID=UPI002298F89A|nr:GNAT family N-acetyltransferase [Citrobacter farmeri]MEC3930926.1 GNAT family N-acetyltransferase [Citrobacter farmeri]HCW7016863.1 GNAT family N-acetyltransferase [Citrobacter farmeri]